MASHIELLLLDTVENLGLVGEVVKVRPGYARNYLLPMLLAEHPTQEKIESLKEARARAEAEVAKQRAERAALIERLAGVTVTLIRSTNDQGLLYGAVTQRDISDELIKMGFGVDTRAVRLSQPFRRVGAGSVTIQFDRDLKADIDVMVKSDRVLEIDRKPETTEEAPAPAAEEAAPGGDAPKAKGKKGKKADAE
jgi:large subunit ribosomal protein L9